MPMDFLSNEPAGSSTDPRNPDNLPCLCRYCDRSDINAFIEEQVILLNLEEEEEKAEEFRESLLEKFDICNDCYAEQEADFN